MGTKQLSKREKIEYEEEARWVTISRRKNNIKKNRKEFGGCGQDKIHSILFLISKLHYKYVKSMAYINNVIQYF